VLSRLDWEHHQLLELVVEVIGVLLEEPVIPTRDEAVHRRRYHHLHGLGAVFHAHFARGKKQKQKHEPSFSGKKTKNLRFRVFFASLSIYKTSLGSC
jgi:hypothetical protein